MKRVAFWAALLALLIGHPLHAQNTDSVSEIKAKIWEAELVQRNFARGLPHCNELNGTNFCFDARDYRRSLDNLVAHGSFNIETRRPWNKEDADARLAQMQKQAVADQASCTAVASLPFLRKKLKELEQQQQTANQRAGWGRSQISGSKSAN